MARKSNTAPAPDFDINALTDETVADMPSRAVTAPRSKRFDNNPFVDRVRDSFNAKKGRQVTVPGYHVKDVSFALRDAAEKLATESIGVRVVYSFGDTVTAKLKDVPVDTDTPVTVMYEGQERKRYLSADEKREAELMGFGGSNGEKVRTSDFLKWVAAGRPMEAPAETDVSA